MNIRVTGSRINPNSIIPELIVSIKIETRLYDGLTPISMHGDLFVSNMKVGTLMESASFANMQEHKIRPLNREGTREHSFFIELSSDINRKAIELIENYRGEDKRGDIKFQIKYKVKFVKSRYENLNFIANQDERLLVSPIERNNHILEISEETGSIVHTIPNSDWVQSYLDKVNNTESVILTFPMLTDIENLSEIDKKINTAIQELKNVKNKINSGDWHELVQATRPIWELLMNKNEIKEYLNIAGYNEETVTSFNNLLHKTFDFVSKFIHFETRNDKKLMEKNHVTKDDALFIYSSAIHVLNLITKKRKIAIME